MSPPDSNLERQKIRLQLRLILVAAGLGLGALLLIGHGVIAEINQAYFGSPTAATSKFDVATMIIAAYSLLAGVIGRWRIF